jgi:nitrogen fixation NifU-like protein
MNNDPLYREIILAHWQDPQNYGVIAHADFDATETNPFCGDEMRVTGKIKNNKIISIAFMGEGCAISKASASLLTGKIKGMNLHEVEILTAGDVLKELGVQLTPARTKCAVLILQTVQKALHKTKSIT